MCCTRLSSDSSLLSSPLARFPYLDRRTGRHAYALLLIKGMDLSYSFIDYSDNVVSIFICRQKWMHEDGATEFDSHDSLLIQVQLRCKLQVLLPLKSCFQLQIRFQVLAKIYDPQHYLVTLQGSRWIEEPFVSCDEAIGSSATRFVNRIMKAAVNWPATGGAEASIYINTSKKSCWYIHIILCASFLPFMQCSNYM